MNRNLVVKALLNREALMLIRAGASFVHPHAPKVIDAAEAAYRFGAPHLKAWQRRQRGRVDAPPSAPSARSSPRGHAGRSEDAATVPRVVWPCPPPTPPAPPPAAGDPTDGTDAPDVSVEHAWFPICSGLPDEAPMVRRRRPPDVDVLDLEDLFVSEYDYPNGFPLLDLDEDAAFDAEAELADPRAGNPDPRSDRKVTDALAEIDSQAFQAMLRHERCR